MNRKYLYYAFPLAGTIFCLWYVFAATCDGIYSDYVRLVNSYLPDVGNPAKFFVPDIFTRIPINYLGRIINIVLFDYNIMFDRVLGVLALGLSGAVLTACCLERRLSLAWAALLQAVIFSLNKWEMLTNGSGWAHFLAFALFYYHYQVLDRVWSGREKPHDRLRLQLLPFGTTLLVAGPYCGVYSLTILSACGVMFLLRRRQRQRGREFISYGLCALIPLLLYLWSNSYGVEDHAAAAESSLITQFRETPGFFARFFIKSFSSMVIGGERAEEIFSGNGPFLVLGALVIFLYLIALWLNWRFKLYERTFLPLMLIVSGGLNHVLILLSRWIFLQENYGLSSRYALQFQAGILGILMTLALVLKRKEVRSRTIFFLGAGAVCGLFLMGNCYTTWVEVKKAPFRKMVYESRAELALRFEECSDDELRANFEYRTSREDSGAKVRSALKILKENGYSVFREEFAERHEKK